MGFTFYFYKQTFKLENNLTVFLEEAESALRQALELDPDRAAWAYALASMLRDRGAYAEALEWALEAVELAPDNTQAQLLVERLRMLGGEVSP